MIDIVERLRDLVCSDTDAWHLCGEAADEIERLREALREMLSVAEVDQLENLSICDIGSERSKMKSRAVASRCGMLLGKLRKIARAALGEGK